jgi:6-pyruvoyltetrahydropterin/6-carboxytetrahydropterin synthase
VFELSVETEFCAAHALSIRGVREVVHGHNWRVTVWVAGPRLDADGLLCDFHAVEAAVAEVTAPFRNANMNESPAFATLNPTAENLARYLADEVSARLRATLPPGAAVSAVRVTEAPGCAATYRPLAGVESEPGAGGASEAPSRAGGTRKAR